MNLAPKTVSYTYDSDGNRAGLTYPNNTTQIAYGYTGRNQLKTITADGPPPIATYSYDLAGNRLGKTLEYGTSASYLYDVANQLLRLEHRKSAGVLAAFDYGYDVAGRRTSRTESSDTQPAASDFYGYDPIDQVTNVSYGSGSGPAWSVKINFQPSNTPLATGYLPDYGAAFASRGNGYSYGWSVDNAAQARDRNVASDQRYDTFNSLQRPTASATWEIAGTYRVRLAAGDASYFDGNFQITAEGQVVLAGAPSTNQRWVEGAAQVTVTDGRLSLLWVYACESACAQPVRGSGEPGMDVRGSATGLLIPLPFGFYIDTGGH